MSDTPPPYRRIAHMFEGARGGDDRVLNRADRDRLLGQPVVVEEKLDGANVVLWVDHGVVRCALRSGPGGADRAGQLGPLRAWAAERTDALRSLLEPGDLALYGEWLLLTHTVGYDALPAYLVALDLRRPDGTFLGVDERNARCRSAGLTPPPELWRGIPGDVKTVAALVGPSRVTAGEAEGVVVRACSPQTNPRLAKLWRPGFAPLPDSAWTAGRPRNRLADREASWH